MLDLSGQIVLITGASGGLGEGVTRTFLAAGAQVAGVARSWRGKQPEGKFLAVEADLTQPGGVRAAVAQVLADTGRLDVLIHLMGGFAGGQAVEGTDDATWERMMSLNLNGAFYAFREVMAHFRTTGQGRIVAVGSRAGVEPGANLSAYNVSKAGLHALVKTVAAEAHGTGITVNAVLPSIIDTDINRKAMPEADFSRWVTPASIASLLLWLASSEGRDVNGALIPMYGKS